MAALPQHIVFGVVAAAMAIAAIRVVTTKNVVHAALYVLLAAEFVFAVQLIVYIGAIVVLFLFGIMLTRAPVGQTGGLDNDQRGLALVVGLFLLGALGTVLHNAFGAVKIAKDVPIQRTADVGISIFQTYLVPFEVVSVLLLAALVGAVVIARRD